MAALNRFINRIARHPLYQGSDAFLAFVEKDSLVHDQLISSLNRFLPNSIERRRRQKRSRFGKHN